MADAQTSNTSTRLWFYYIITKIHPPFQNLGSTPAGVLHEPKRTQTEDVRRNFGHRTNLPHSVWHLSLLYFPLNLGSLNGLLLYERRFTRVVLFNGSSDSLVY